MGEMNRRDFSKRIAGVLGAAVFSPSVSGSRESLIPVAEKPNIVFICSDQHHSKYTGYAGHPIVKTPNLDRIAKEGVVFSSAYCGNPVCVAGRSSMMTGMYASDCNSFCNSTVWDGSYPTWGTHLSKNGYHCRATGKMDLNDRFDMGFTEVETKHGHAHNPDITALFRRPPAYRIGSRANIIGQSREKRHTGPFFLGLEGLWGRERDLPPMGARNGATHG